MYYKAKCQGEYCVIEYASTDHFYRTGIFGIYHRSQFEWIDDNPITF